MFVVLNILFGAVLGMRFKVFVLFPAIAVGAALTASVAAMQGTGVWSTVVATALSIVGLQLGFLGGVVTRHFVAASRVPHPRGAAEPATAAGRSPGR